MKLRICVGLLNNWVHWNSLTFQLNFRVISTDFLLPFMWSQQVLFFFFCHSELINFSEILFWSFVFIHTHNRNLKVQSRYQLKPLKISFCESVYGDVLWQAVSWQQGEISALAAVTQLFLKGSHQCPLCVNLIIHIQVSDLRSFEPKYMTWVSQNSCVQV